MRTLFTLLLIANLAPQVQADDMGTAQQRLAAASGPKWNDQLFDASTAVRRDFIAVTTAACGENFSNVDNCFRRAADMAITMGTKTDKTCLDSQSDNCKLAQWVFAAGMANIAFKYKSSHAEGCLAAVPLKELSFAKSWTAYFTNTDFTFEQKAALLCGDIQSANDGDNSLSGYVGRLVRSNEPYRVAVAMATYLNIRF